MNFDRFQKNILGLIVLGYTLVLLSVFGMWWFFAAGMAQQRELSTNLYVHPFAVSNAALEMKGALFDIRNDVVQLVLIRDKADDPAVLFRKTNDLERTVAKDLAIIKAHFLGDMSKVNELEAGLQEWLPIRTEIYDAVRKGDFGRAEFLVKRVGTPKFSEFNPLIDYVIIFAQDKARYFAEAADKNADSLMARNRMAALGMAAFLVLTGAMVFWRVRSLQVSEIEHKQALIVAKQQAETALEMQRKMQNEMVQSEKLAALGGLVAGIAHEINTPVGVTLSAATHLDAETRKADRAYKAGELTEEGLTEYFTTAREATQLMTVNSQRAAGLIHGFKQVAVDQTAGERRSFDLAAYIDEVLSSLRPQFKKSTVKVHVDCPEGVMMDTLPGALSQVLTNLLMNSLIHAFRADQSGNVYIACRATGSKAGDVEISFRDDGRGMPPEITAHLFEPFFTTRRGKGGSGLGLHIVHTLATQSLKGSIDMTSVPGRGTEFVLRLPRVLGESNPEIES